MLDLRQFNDFWSWSMACHSMLMCWLRFQSCQQKVHWTLRCIHMTHKSVIFRLIWLWWCRSINKGLTAVHSSKGGCKCQFPFQVVFWRTFAQQITFLCIFGQPDFDVATAFCCGFLSMKMYRKVFFQIIRRRQQKKEEKVQHKSWEVCKMQLHI